MSLFIVAAGDFLGGLLYATPQGVRGQYFGIRAETEQCAHQPVVLCWWAAKTEQSSLLAKRLNGVAQVGIAFHSQDSTRREPDAYLWMRGMPVGKLRARGL